MRIANFAFVAASMVASTLVIADSSAQAASCSSLLAQINSASHSGGGKYASAAAKQRNEIIRTQQYASSIGCDRQQFLFFGKAPPPQCAGLRAHIGQMQANMGALLNASENSGGGRKAALQAQYDANCRDPQPQVASAQPQRGLFDGLFGNNRQPDLRDTQFEDQPIDKPRKKDSEADNGDGEPRHSGGGRVAICVKYADGGFFPMTYGPSRSDLEDLDALCKALCPATQAGAFIWDGRSDIKEARDVDDRSYGELPNALKFETKYVAEASCRPQGKSWAEVLGAAEAALGEHSRHDILVTPQRAAELSRARDPNALAALAKKQQTSDKSDAEMEAFTASLAKAANNNVGSAGIGGGRETSGPIVSVNQGQLQDQIGPDGVTRKVRIIVPTL